MLKLTVPIVRKLTLNQLIRTLLNCVTKCRTVQQASAIYYKQKKEAQLEVKKAIDRSVTVSEPLKDYQLVCVWRPKDKKLDQDNLSTCLKPILDGLAEASIIEDDSPKYMRDVIIHIFDYNYIGKKNDSLPLQETVDIYLMDNDLVSKTWLMEALTTAERNSKYDLNADDWLNI